MSQALGQMGVLRTSLLLALAFLIVHIQGAQVHYQHADSQAFNRAAALQNAVHSSWCQPDSTQLSLHELHVPGRTILSKPDTYTCSVVKPMLQLDVDQLFTATALHVPSSAVEVYQLWLWDCHSSLWQLRGISDEEHLCLANTAALQASCNQWLVMGPGAGGGVGLSCAPPNTAFASSKALANRVMVLQVHWRMKPDAIDSSTAVELPDVKLQLGSTAATSGHSAASMRWHARLSGTDSAVASSPPLLGTFVGSGIYPPSILSHGLQAFTATASADRQTVTAELACGKRCTYLPLGRLQPKPVNIVGYSFSTLDHATAVAVELQRSWAGKAAGHVLLKQQQWQALHNVGGLVVLDKPVQLFPGDIVRWRCTYNTSDLPPGSSITGGHNSPAQQHQQCTVLLHYWPRVEAMRGCLAATAADKLLGENMCSSEAQDLLRLAAADEQQFPMRRMYQEHSFPKASWMGGWKATHIVLQMAAVLAMLWGSKYLLQNCKALGTWHRRFRQLDPGQQRNVSVYIMHLVLDTAALASLFQPMIELWFGFSETTADVRAGVFGFTYIVACYALELTWRRSLDVMLAVHHVGTIVIILLYAGELTAYTYRVANNIIVLASFALLEQPTYVALLFKRMLPSHSLHVVNAARVGYISWFILKGLSIVIAATMFREDWHLMPRWIKINFLATWLVACVVQAWSGLIQYGIYKQVRHSYFKAREQRLRQLPDSRRSSDKEDSSGDDSEPSNKPHLHPLLTPSESDGSEDCTAAVALDALVAAFAKYQAHTFTVTGSVSAFGRPDNAGGSTQMRLADLAGLGAATLAGYDLTLGADVGKGYDGVMESEVGLSPSSSGSLANGITGSDGARCAPDTECGVQAAQASMRPPRRQTPDTSSVVAGHRSRQGSSSSSQVYHPSAVQRRSRSGSLNMIECGVVDYDS